MHLPWLPYAHRLYSWSYTLAPTLLESLNSALLEEGQLERLCTSLDANTLAALNSAMEACLANSRCVWVDNPVGVRELLHRSMADNQARYDGFQRPFEDRFNQPAVIFMLLRDRLLRDRLLACNGTLTEDVENSWFRCSLGSGNRWQPWL